MLAASCYLRSLQLAGYFGFRKVCKCMFELEEEIDIYLSIYLAGAGARQAGPGGGEGGRAPGLHHPQPPVQLPLSHRGHGRHPVQVSGGDYRDPSIVIVLQGQDPQWAI